MVGLGIRWWASARARAVVRGQGLLVLGAGLRAFGCVGGGGLWRVLEGCGGLWRGVEGFGGHVGRGRMHLPSEGDGICASGFCGGGGE